MFLVFSYSWFKVEFKSRMSVPISPLMPRRQMAALTIRDACFAATLVALRDLEDCLTRKEKRHEDDLRASEWGFEAGGFLGTEVRKQIDKLVVHSTTFGLRDEAEPKIDIEELTMKGVTQGLRFLRWVEVTCKVDGEQVAKAAAQFYTIMVESTLRDLEGWKRKEQAISKAGALEAA